MSWSIFFWPFLAAGFFVMILVGLLVLGFIIWMIIDCAKRRFRNDGEKIIWIVLMVITTWVGALVYYIVIRSLNPKGLSKK